MFIVFVFAHTCRLSLNNMREENLLYLWLHIKNKYVSFIVYGNYEQKLLNV